METEKFSPAAKDIYKQALHYVSQKEVEARKTGKITVTQLFELASGLFIPLTGQSS